MEKILKLFTYVDGRNDTPFPNEQEQVVVSEFRGDYKRMGATPTISCTVMHHKCLDKLWTDNVYATFNGEKFFIKQTASSSYDNTDSRYKHEVELVSERIILDNVYFYDVVQSDVTNDKPVSNSSNVVFFGDIHEFANRLNYSLQYSKVGYSVVVDDGISSEGKMMSFQNQFFSNVLQEIYNNYGIPYYFVGKVIHIGYTNNAITHTFKYGVDESLLSIQKQNANYKLVNRVTGVGSADNIPYYYPNDYESKEEVEANGGTWINPQPNLMPSIYRETLGDERFYKALNNTYVSPQTGEYYYFENPFVEGKPKEHIVNFDEIKPSIKGMLNASNQRIDMFVDFAYDVDDNDETDEEGNYLHPYFFAKLRKFDGDYGFNLFDHAIDEQEMVISMTSGSCGACEWIIGVDETSQKNTVQVNSSGNLVRDDKGNIKFGTPQDRQNDTRNYEVWVALKKDINTFGVIMPNASSNYKPSVNDTFVILHIDLPKAYILSAENNLKEQLIKYMAMNNSEKFTFSISFSRIFFAENPQILAQLNENARIQIEYDNTNYELYVSSYSYNMSNGSPLPEIKVELSDTLSVQQNALQNAISEVKQDIMSSVGSGDFLKQGLAYFLRKDTSDRTRGKLSSDVGFEVGRYVSGASGAIIYKDSSTGQTIGEVDKLYVRMKAYFETLVISDVNTISGKQIISPAGSIKCIGVDEIENAYRCYFLGEQDGSETSNLFHVNDQAYSQTFNAKEGVNNKISNTYYWRLITNVSSDLVVYKNQRCHYIDLSKTDCDQGSDIPKEGDIINHRGSRNDIDRMNFIESSSVDALSPNITLFQGVNSYSLDGKDYVSYGVDKTTNKAYMNVYGDMFVGDRNGSTYMRYTPEEGLVIKGKLDIETKLGDSTLKDLISASSPEGYQEFVEKVTQDIEGLQQQIDGAIESYFYQYEPTLSNYPASSWNTKKLQDAHLNDTFTNLVDGRSWRWTIENGNYKWTEITDTATTQALALAGQAQDTADGRRRVFVAQPKPPYDKGDLWSRGKDYPLLVCVTAKGANGVYNESDWDYADNTGKLEETISTFDYLKTALKEDTSIEGGLIQSSLIKLGYTSSNTFKVMSGSNGIYNASLNGGGIASWWGGDTYDLLDYYNWDGTQWVKKSGVTVPSNIPSGLIRFDGTGYFAKGKFWWDNNGEIHADPTALLLSFDVATGDETLASTIINIRKDLASFMDMWEVKKLSDGTEYLYSKRHLATNGGVTMYALDEGDIPSILDSLPIASTSSAGIASFDSTYFSVNASGKVTLTSAPSGASILGSLQDVSSSVSGTTNSDVVLFKSANTSTWTTKPLSEIGGGSVSGDYLPLSGGTINGAGDYLYVPLLINALNNQISGITFKTNGTERGHIGYSYELGMRLHTASTAGIAVSNSDVPIFYTGDGSVKNTILHSGNYSSYALPLSGGTITGTLTIAPSNGQSLISERASGVPYISFRRSSSEYYGHIGVNSTGDPIMQSTVKGSSAWEKIWYEGNDGSGSGLDADLLDGVHAAFMFYARSKVITSSNVNSQMDNGVYYTAGYAPISDAYGYGTFLNFRSNAVGVNSRQAQFYIVDGAQVERGGRIYFRDSWNSTNDITTPWYEIITSKRIGEYNAGSSTKLQTARTIWGQSFDGTGNVDGRFLSSLNLSTSTWVSDTAQIRANATGTKYYIGVAVTTSGLAVIQGGDSGTGSLPLLLNPNGGYVGVGTENPISNLHVLQGAWGNGITIDRNASESGAGITVCSKGSRLGEFGVNGELKFQVAISPSIGSSAVLKFQVDKSGNVLAYGGVTMYSDQRKKTILNHVELSLKQIADAPLIQHYYNSDQDKTTHVGSIAQYWAGINDWFCKLDNEGYYTMEIQNCALASAISIARHLEKYESKTDKKIRQLKKRISQLEDELELLKKGV